MLIRTISPPRSPPWWHCSLRRAVRSRGGRSPWAYVDDAAITTSIKGRYVENKAVDASSIKVETLNGTVMLSGSAKNAGERSMAETIARGVNGVKAVKNEIAVRP